MQIINGPNRPYSIAQIRVLHTGSFHSFSTLLTFTCGLSSLVNGFQPICWLFMLAKQNTCFSKLRAVISMLESSWLVANPSLGLAKILKRNLSNSWAIYALSRSNSLLPRRTLKNIYRSLFESHLHFGSIVWGCAKQSYIKKSWKYNRKNLCDIFLTLSLTPTQLKFFEIWKSFR